MVEEYVDVLTRVGRGLLENGYLKESEMVFNMLREVDSDLPDAKTALDQISSKRHLEAGRVHLDLGEQLLSEKKYRDALSELKKSEVELNSVQILKYDDVAADFARKQKLMGEAKHYVYLEDASVQMREAEKSLKFEDFKKAEGFLSKASNLVGRAAFFKRDSELVDAARRRLVDLAAELEYLVPNAIPVMNRFTKDMQGKIPDFFYLTNHDFDVRESKDHTIKLGIKYLRSKSDQFFIVRYRVFMANGKDFFNGHFLMPVEKDFADGDELTATFEQEIPDAFHKIPVRRVEFRIFNHNDEIVSSITRAFKTSTAS